MKKHFLFALLFACLCVSVSFAQVVLGSGVVVGTTGSTYNLPSFPPHQWMGNCTGVSAIPSNCLIGTSDFSPGTYAVDTGTVNALVATLSPAPTAYAAGLWVQVLPAFANTTSQPPVAPTLNVNGFGAAPIIKAGGNALVAGDLLTTEIAVLIMDAAGNWELQNPQTNSGGGGGGSSSTTFANIDDLGTGSTPGPPWSLDTAAGQTGGTQTPLSSVFSINNPTPSKDGESMLLQETTRSSAGQTNILAVFKSGDTATTVDSIVQLSFDVEVYITNAGAASSFEFDQFIFSKSLNLEFMFGSQCYAGFWDVFNQATNHWIATSGTCSFASNTWYRVQESVHRVLGDTSCGGRPCMYYDSITVNGVPAPGFVPVSYPPGTLPGGWGSNTGFQFQIDSASTSQTISEYMDIASFTESAGSAAGSITGVTAGTGLTGGGTTGNVSLALATALPNGETATTQAPGDNTTDVATDAFVLANNTGGVGNGSTINPGYIGSGNNNFCYTDPTVNTTAAVCAAAFKATTPAMSSGVIIDNRPYDVTTNFFLGTKKWTGRWELGTGTGGTTPSTANPTAWILEVPLILPTGADIVGLTGPGVGYGGDTSGSSILMTGTNFPGPIPPPNNGAFTVTPSTSGGHLADATYKLELVYTNNLMGSTSGNPVAGYSYHTVEQNVVISGGGGNGSIVISGVPTANCGGCGGGSPFNATGFAAAISTVSGQELAACNQTLTASSGCVVQAATCATPDTSDPDGACLLGGNETITNLPTFSATNAAFAPPVVDLTSVAIVLGDTNSTSFGNSNSFAQTLQGIILVAGPVYKQTSCGTSGNHCIPAATTPSVAVWSRTMQEGSIADQIDAWGPWQGAIFYIGHGNTGGIRAFQPNGNQYIDASASSTTGSPFYNVVVDGCMYNVVSEVNLFSSSFNYHPHGTVTQASSNVYARGCGNATYVNAYGLHTEEWNSNAGSDNYTADWGATINLFGGAGFANGGAVLHRTSTGTAINNAGMAQQGFFGAPCIQDDARTLTIEPGSSRANFPCNYDSVNYVAKNALVSNQSAISSTAFVNIGASGSGNSAFTFGLVPNGRYKLACEIYATSSASTAGPQIQVTGPASPTGVQNSLIFTPTATLTASTLYSSGFSTPVSAGTAVTSAATAEYRFVETIQNGSNSGTITVQDAPQGTGNLTNLTGSECELTPQTQVP